MHLDKAVMLRLIWATVAFVIFGVGFGGVWWPMSQSIDRVRSHARDLYEEANQNDAMVLRASDVHAAQNRIHSDIVALGGERNSGAVTAALLRLFNRESQTLSVDVRTLTPATAPSSVSAARYLKSETNVAVGVRGPFRNIVNLIADLPRHDVLIEIHDARITSNEATVQSPVLDLSFDATIYRIVQMPVEEKNVRAL
jgi:Tfp pilus assembly protein PilO